MKTDVTRVVGKGEGLKEAAPVGRRDGIAVNFGLVGDLDGTQVGVSVGDCDGVIVGSRVGMSDGVGVGRIVGWGNGICDGSGVGDNDGNFDSCDGDIEGDSIGSTEGCIEGVARSGEGCSDIIVGSIVGMQDSASPQQRASYRSDSATGTQTP